MIYNTYDYSLGNGGHEFTQVLTDIPRDRLEGVRGLPQLMGQRASALAAAPLAADLKAAHGRDHVLGHSDDHARIGVERLFFGRKL